VRDHREGGHAADRGGFGIVSVSRERGLFCRGGCDLRFLPDEAPASAESIQRAAAARDAHELAEHDLVWIHRPAPARRRRHEHGR
jgi:hypothetical protein